MVLLQPSSLSYPKLTIRLNPPTRFLRLLVMMMALLMHNNKSLAIKLIEKDRLAEESNAKYFSRSAQSVKYQQQVCLVCDW